MSLLSTALRDQVIAPTEPVPGGTSGSLADLAPGAELVVGRRAPMADPVVFRVAGCEMALRREQARCIRVCVEA